MKFGVGYGFGNVTRTEFFNVVLEVHTKNNEDVLNHHHADAPADIVP